MAIITMTFKFLDGTNQPRDWAVADQTVINTLGLTNVSYPNQQRITGRRNVMSPAQCASWTAVFDLLNAPYAIFSDAGGQNAVLRNQAPCIGTLIASNAVTLYLKSRVVPPVLAQAVQVAVAAPAVAALANSVQVANYLTQQQFIRVYIPASLSRGHQSTTCLVIRRLIALGYTGAIEVIYVNTDDNATTIRVLLPELALVVNGQDIAPNNYQSAALGNCVFTFATRASGVPAQQRQFGISGGVDNPDDDPRVFCHVVYFLMLQPFQWSAANYLYPQAPHPIDLGNEALLGRLAFLGTTNYWTDVTAYPWNVVSTEIARLPLAAQAAVTAIQANCCVQNATKHLIPVYGLARGPGVETLSNWNAVTQLAALANLVIAVLEGQATAPLNQGTVMMTLDSYAPNWNAELLKLLPAPYQARISFYLDGTPWNNNMITNLGNTNLLIANFPRFLPAPLFNYFFLNSFLPPVFEGKGTMPIVLNSGRPYLQLSKQSNGFDTLLAVTQAAVIKRLKAFLYPSIPYQYQNIMNNTGQQTVQDLHATTCLMAEQAVVWNTPPAITINAATFNVDANQFIVIQTYLQTHSYIDANNRILNKFMALLNAADFENPPPQGITKVQMYTDLQTACGIGVANVCTIYRNKIALLTTFFVDATINPQTALRTNFTALGFYFNNVANDKLLQGLGFAVAAIAAGL